ncbi:MAG: FapA family protein, partial [Treponema sp.]|nr:FapA family protein [Treponema sp.]
REAAGEYIKVGDYSRNPANDSTVSIDILEGEMKAAIKVNNPGPGGRDYSAENYINFLHSNKVNYGIKDDAINQLVDKPVYGEMVVVAEGDKVIDGQDAYIQYNFEIDNSKVRLQESKNGRVNFKDLNIIQNVVENQPLAVKIAAEKGRNGKNIRGVALPAKDGKDIPLPLGKNVHQADDGITILADINGQVLVVNGKINVEEVYTVDGGVNLKSGNIDFQGTVIINGDVEDGFFVKAVGNIEVNGTVEKAELISEGDIIVTQGITGKGTGLVKAGHSVWAKFIENSSVESGDLVVVSDGIINSHVDAANRVLCQGKRATIVGGRVRAREEINAKTLGSPVSGTETILEVGLDPKQKSELAFLIEKKERVRKEFEELQRNIQTLINIKKQRKALPEDKEFALQELMGQRQTMIPDIKKTEEDLVAVQEALNNTKVRGRVSASAKVYPGVRVMVRDAREDVRNEYSAVTFVLEDGLIRVTGYEETDQDLTKAPDGYTTD